VWGVKNAQVNKKRAELPIGVAAVATTFNGSSGAGFVIAFVLGADCATKSSGITICTDAVTIPGGRGTIFGSVFITKDVVSSVDVRPVLIEHEPAHSLQRAVNGPLIVPNYFAATFDSFLMNGDGACAEVHEVDANLANGGYGQCL
jgi:hypothetical protein